MYVGVPRASFRFYAELNDFLPLERRQVEFEVEFGERQSVKHLIEALGVPHTEVDLVLVNGQPVPFGYLVQNGDRVSVYPVFESFDVSAVTQIRAEPLRQIRFAADSHLGRLAAYLRMLGFDTFYRNYLSDAELARLAQAERRVVLTRDRELLMRSAITHGYYVRHTAPRLQLREVVERFHLARQARPFTRCMVCNGLLQEALVEEVRERIPPRSREHATETYQCADCGQLYWDGSHYRRMRRLVEAVLGHESEKEQEGHGLLRADRQEEVDTGVCQETRGGGEDRANPEGG